MNRERKQGVFMYPSLDSNDSHHLKNRDCAPIPAALYFCEKLSSSNKPSANHYATFPRVIHIFKDLHSLRKTE